MPVKTDLSGRRFGKWLVLHRVKGNNIWMCRCDCGTEKMVHGGNLPNGSSKSCGCVFHGMSDSSEYQAWLNMKDRCYDKNNNRWIRYGGRGIVVCDDWLGQNGFIEFFKHMGPKPSRIHQIDRINNNGNYEPGNCRWATPTEQSRNTARNRILTFGGKTMTLVEWEIETGIRMELIRGRIDRCGWSVAKALTTPTDERKTGRYGVRRKVRRQ